MMYSELVNTISGGDIPLVGLSSPAILGLAVLMLMTGRLVPRSALDDKIKECDRWREAYENERTARLEDGQQTVELLDVTKTTHSFITAVFRNSERLRVMGEQNVATKE